MILCKLNTIYTICNIDIYSGTKVLEFGSSTPPPRGPLKKTWMERRIFIPIQKEHYLIQEPRGRLFKVMAKLFLFRPGFTSCLVKRISPAVIWSLAHKL